MKKVIKKIGMMISTIVCIGMIVSQPMQIFASQNVSEINEKVDLSQESVQNFLDEYFPRKMEEYHVPGGCDCCCKRK